MPRIDLITEKSQIPEDRHAEYDEIVGVLGRVGGPFGILMYSPGLAAMVCKTGAQVRLGSELTMVERELALLSTCREKDAAYEWSSHVETARKAGMREEAIDAMRSRGDTASLEPDERDIIDFTRQLLRTNRVEQDVFDALTERHGTRWLVELTATIGQYQYIAAINNAFGMEARPDGEQLPDPMSEPRADKPVMPDGYGVTPGEGALLPWTWADERLTAADNFWFSTTRPNNVPHAMPAWGVWLDGYLYFEGSPETRRARNLAENPNLSIHLEDAVQALIIEGVAEVMPAPPSRELAERLSQIFSAKYGGPPWEYKPEVTQWDEGGLWRLVPRTAFGWTSFPTDCTRWHFD